MSQLKFYLSFIIFLLILSPSYSQRNYDPLWHQIEAYELKQLPKSANQLVDSVYRLAKQENNEVQVIKALIFQSKFSLALEEDAQVKIIHNFEQEIASAQGVYQNILNSMLGELYRQYYQQNRSKFYNRTKTETIVNPIDFRTWDINTLFIRIRDHYLASLENREKLQQRSLDEFGELLHAKDTTFHIDHFTLYDFVAYRALDFFTLSESTVNKPIETYSVNDVRFLQDYRYLPVPKTDSSFVFLALSIYKNLFDFHSNSEDPSAFVFNSVKRAEFLYGIINISQKEKLFDEVLTELANRYKDYEISAYVLFKLAEHYTNLGNEYHPELSNKYQFKKSKAVEICAQAMASYPQSMGAKLCEKLKEKIKIPTLSIRAENKIPINKYAKALVSYINLDSIRINVYAISPHQEDDLNELRNEASKTEFISKLNLVDTWTASLKNERDFQQHSIEILLPPFAQGQYVILAENASPDFQSAHYQIIGVTDLALIHQQMQGKNTFQVIDRNNGRPMENAAIQLTRPTDKVLYTDTNGFVEFDSKESLYNVRANVSKDNDWANFKNLSFYPYNSDRRQNQGAMIRNMLFTDRSIYRPGQKVYFKGILLQTGGFNTLREEKTHGVASKEQVKVILQDANRRTIQELELISNEFGSFSGEFILPNTGLTGIYSILIQEGKNDNDNSGINFVNGTHSISVEEYKRPKFEAVFHPMKVSHRVNDEISVKGSATSYAGSAVSEAKVSYRVYRMAQMPPWFYRFNSSRSFVQGQNQEISFGATMTDKEGNFKVEFKAVADENIDKEHLPVFQYQILADVTDINGETRTAKINIRVGYHALLATATINNKVSKADSKTMIEISTLNLNQEFVPAEGTMSIYKVLKPDRVTRERPWENPDYKNWTEDTFKNLFPHEIYGTHPLQDPEKGKLVWRKSFDSDKNRTIELKGFKRWEEGMYILELETKDAFGQVVKDKKIFTVFDPNSNKVADNNLFEIVSYQDTYQLGERVKFRIGSAADKVFVTLKAENSLGILSSEIVELNNESKDLFFPITTNETDGFAVHYHVALANSFINGTVQIPVVQPEEKIEIETSTFRDKILPGNEEKWSFKIKGAQKDKIAAEILAGMYDASLDEFKPHSWNFKPLSPPKFYPKLNTVYYSAFGASSFNNLSQRNFRHLPKQEISFQKLNWFGFSFNQNYTVYRQYMDEIGTKHSRMRQNDRKDDTIEKGYVQGHIYEVTGEPLGGVSVRINGTSRGTLSDRNGFYSIKAEKGEELIVTFIGMKTTRRLVDKNNVVNFFIASQYETLNEIVVTGYGAAEKKSTNIRIAGASVTGAEEPLYEITDTPAIEQQPLSEEDIFLVQARTNFSETALFYPHLQTDKEGNFSFTFTAPEALTRWKLQLLAHSKDVKLASKTLYTVTQKELMVIPNAPRFLRQGDQLVLTAKIVNMGKNPLEGNIGLELRDALTDELLKTITNEQRVQKAFKLDANGNTMVSWALDIPNDLQAVQYKIIAAAGYLSDGEQSIIPVLTNRMLVTETLPFWIRSGEKSFTLDKLKTQDSPTLQHHQLSLELTSNPAWYAIQALPFLIEGPKENAEQVFSLIFANAVGSHLMNSQPKIKAVFDQWKSDDALISNLEKNQELKSIMLAETPWLRDAQSEKEQKKRIALLFDVNKIKNDLPDAISRLKQYQLPDGGFVWYMGSPKANNYISNHIMQGLGQMQKTGIALESKEYNQLISSGLKFLNSSLLEDQKLYQERMRSNASLKNDLMVTSRIINTLFSKSYFKEELSDNQVEKVVDFYTSQLPNIWTSFSLSEKAMIALILHRSGKDQQVVQDIMRSLLETSTFSEEMGRYWLGNIAGYGWNEAPVETQSLLIETFSEFGEEEKHREIIDELKIWLLKSKQTNRWQTTKATTAAVNAIINSGSNWIASTSLPSITMGGQSINPSEMEGAPVEAGTGYFKRTWSDEDIKPEMAEVLIKKEDEGISWGALYWQYFEDLNKITSAATPLQINKKLFVKTNTDRGELLRAVDNNSSLNVGDLVRVRIEIKVDRDMGFVHLKDMRASGMEPVNVLSSYKYQDGLGYYESTRDAASHFYFERIPKGVYVFEYDLRVSHQGQFSNGITTIQSMYAPEFSSHSEGIKVEVK